MRYTLIQGSFQVIGFSPDGDSIRFVPDDAKQWDRLSESLDEYKRNIFEKKRKEAKKKYKMESTQLRLQSVDALETHYRKGGVDYHQPTDLGLRAADAFLELFGIKEVKWGRRGKATIVNQVKIGRKYYPSRSRGKTTIRLRGYIVSGEAGKYGRPISWVFPSHIEDEHGEPLTKLRKGAARLKNDIDGTDLSRQALKARIKESANYVLLRKGLVYPYFEASLPAIFRKELIKGVRYAVRRAVRDNNLWAHDLAYSEGITINSVADFADTKDGHTANVLLWPDWFREVLTSWHASGAKTFKLEDHLARHQYVFIDSRKDFVRLDQVIELDGNRMRLTEPIYDIVLLSTV